MFTRGEYRTEDGNEYVAVEAEGTVFVPYGFIRGRGPLRDLSYACGDCLGCLSGDEKDRLCALRGDDTGKWPIEFYETGIMGAPMVGRELRGNGPVPESVASFEDEAA